MTRLNSKLLLLFMALLFSAISVQVAGSGSVMAADTKGFLVGQVMQDGNKPLASGRLFIYNRDSGPPSADSYVRVPDLIYTLDQAGKFVLDLPAGTYYLSAVKQPETPYIGPPPIGEPIYFQVDDKNEIQPYQISSGKTTDAGIISRSVPYRRIKESNNDTAAIVEGIVANADGAPVKGAVIYAYLTAGVQEKAYSVSERTGDDGKFRIRFTEGGTYFLRVRSDYGGGTPKEGEIVNLNDPKEMIAVTVAKGEKRSGVVLKIKLLQQRGPLFRN
jgi:hypothetical protein